MLHVHVFGKRGCAKCALLNKRLDSLLDGEFNGVYEKHYHDCLEEDSMVRFCQAGCLNPGKIPVMLVSDENDNWIERSEESKADIQNGNDRSLPYMWVGVQTDYSEQHKGVITLEMIRKVLLEGMKQGGVL